MPWTPRANLTSGGLSLPSKPQTQQHPKPPGWFVRAHRPRPRTFAVQPLDLKRLDTLSKHGYRHRSKVLRAIIRQFDEESVRGLLQYAQEPELPPGAIAPTMVTVSMAMQPDDLQKLNDWTKGVPFPSRSSLVRAMIRWAYTEDA